MNTRQRLALLITLGTAFGLFVLLARSQSNEGIPPASTETLLDCRNSDSIEAYDGAVISEIARLLKSGLPLDETARQYNKSALATRGRTSVSFFDEHQSAVLAALQLYICPSTAHQIPLPQIIVFNRTGRFWRIGAGKGTNVKWVEDRWVGFFDIREIDYAAPVFFYYFWHIVQKDGNWELQPFLLEPRPPAFLEYHREDAVYEDGYRRIIVPFVERRDGPCTFKEEFMFRKTLGLREYTLTDEGYAISILDEESVIRRWNGKDEEIVQNWQAYCVS